MVFYKTGENATREEAITIAGRERTPQVIRIAGFLKRSAVNGPGLRSVIWVQGCPHHCEGCFNESLWDISGGKTMRVDRLSDMILSTRDIDGVTFSGGEPFFQAGALAKLAKTVHSRGLSVMTFSGYPYDLLIGSGKRSWQCLMAETDLLVSGPYLKGQPSSHPLLGSSNQQIHYLTDRIDPEKRCPETAAVAAEYTISPDGTMLVTGFPVPSLVDRLRSQGAAGGM